MRAFLGQSQTLGREKLLKRLLYEKCVRKMLMKLTPGGVILLFFKMCIFHSNILGRNRGDPVYWQKFLQDPNLSAISFP